MASQNHHIDRVRVDLSGGEVEFPWTSRVALLGEMRHLDSARPIVDAFEAVGVSRPVVLTQEQKGLLVELIESWATQTRWGLSGLPEGDVRAPERAPRRPPSRR